MKGKMMDRKSLLNGRLSLSTSNLSSPIAESTHIGGLQQKFPWGGIHSPVKTIENTQNISRTINETTKKASLNNSLQRLDPRIYTDVQSQGLTSRIVKYYENSMKLNRSASFSNLYNKPGQFPVVHLKKNEIPYKPSKNRNNVSIVRIAPPDKCVFQANSRSSILRSGSVVPTISLGLKQANNDISRENRPILHPTVENETAPTRSVLEALKEISRKRINSDELDCNDSIKKYCKDSNYESTSNLTNPLASLSTNPNPVSSNYARIATKRHRDLTSPSISPSAKIPNNRQMSESAIKPRKINNEFTSSISSSLSLLTPKRKYSEQLVCSGKSSPISNDMSLLIDQPRQKQKFETVGKLIGVEDNKREVKNQSTNVTYSLSAAPVINSSSEFEKPTRTLSEPTVKVDSKFLSTANLKPKLTLFNKNYDDSQKFSSKNLDDDDDIPKIPFVKPKNDIAGNRMSFTKNAMIEKTQKSKLALMLSGLRGDLEEDQDEVDNKDTIKIAQDKIKQTQSEIQQNYKLDIQSPNLKNENNIPKSTDENNLKIQNPDANTKPINESSGKGGFKFPFDQSKGNTTHINSESSKSYLNKPAKKQISNLVVPEQNSNGKATNSEPIASIGTSSEIKFDNLKQDFGKTTSGFVTLEKNQKDNITFPPTSKSPEINFKSVENFSASSNLNTQNSVSSKPLQNVSQGFATTTFSNAILSIPTKSDVKNLDNKTILSQSPTKNLTSPSSVSKIMYNLLNPMTEMNNFTQQKNSNNNSVGNGVINSQITFGANAIMGTQNGSNSTILNTSSNLNSQQTTNLNKQNTNTVRPGGFAFNNNSNQLQNIQNSENANTKSASVSLFFNPESKQIGSTFENRNQPSATITSTSSFNQQKPTFNFGTSQQPAAVTSAFSFSTTSNPTSQNNQNNNAFQFGNANSTQNQSTFSFKNSDSSNDSKIPISGQLNENNKFMFGGNSTVSTMKNIFGTNVQGVGSDQPVMQDSKNNPSFTTSDGSSFTKSPSSFTFGNNAQSVSSANKNPGSIAAAAPFSFGSQSQNNSQTNSTNNSNLNSTFNFGGNNNPPANIFLANNTENKLNTFGNASSNPNTNLFGNSNATTLKTNSFIGNNSETKTIANNTANSFNNNIVKNNSNTFGNTNQSQANNSDGKFSFSQQQIANTHNTQNNNSSTFSFGGSNNTQKNSNFTFGANNMVQPSAAENNKQPGFSFSGNTTTNNNIFSMGNNNNVNSTNIFNPAATAPGDRPMRKATRRLNK